MIARITFIFALLCTPLAFSQTSVTGCFTLWPPYSQTEGNQPTGISVEIMKAAAKWAEIELTLTQLPWKRCLLMVKNGQIDFAMDSVQRDDFIQGSYPTALYNLAFWAHEDDTIQRFQGLESFKEYRLGLFNGYAYPADIADATFAKVEYLHTEENAARMIAANRLDITLADTVVMSNVIDQLNLPLKMLQPLFRIQALRPAFNLGNEPLMQQFDTALQHLHESGSIDAIYLKFTGKPFRDFYGLEPDAAITPLSP